jgi:transposase
VNRYDRRRDGKKLSNKDWVHPHDVDARIGRDKKGITRMLYKVVHVVDLETNALIGVRIAPGDDGDAESPTDYVIETEMSAAEATDSEEMDLPIKTLTTDMGYRPAREVSAHYHEYGIMPNIPDPILNRNIAKMTEEERTAHGQSKQFVQSPEGKQLQKKRTEYIERSFAHSLESGGGRTDNTSRSGEDQQTISC